MNDWQDGENGEHPRGFDDDRIEGLLDELREADPPPPWLVREVMTRVRATTNAVTQRRTGDPGMTSSMAKKALIGLAAAAALVVALFTTLGWPPAVPGAEGTIGAAKRHQAQQMTPQDVKLGDTATQEFLQSDVVARLMADAGARAALTDPSVRAVLADASVRVALADATVRAALANANARDALAKSGAQAANNAALRQAAGNAAFQQALQSGLLLRVIESAALMKALETGALARAIESGAIGRVLENELFARMLGNAALADALTSQVFLQALESKVLMQALDHKAAELGAVAGAVAR
jgi:hypothetical protein